MILTTTEAARYLADHGYTVGRRRAGGKGPPSGDTVKRWCEQGKFPGARKASGRLWLIPQAALDEFLKRSA